MNMNLTGGLVVVAFLLSLDASAPTFAADSTPAPSKPSSAPSMVQALKGQVIKIEGEQYVVRDAMGKEVRLHVNQETILQADLHVGDKVDVEMASDGKALTLLRALQ